MIPDKDHRFCSLLNWGMRMRTLGVGHILFALAIFGLGVVGLTTGHFADGMQPVPAHFPARDVLAHANGVLMLVLGLGLLVKRSAGLAAVVLTVYLLIWFFLLHGPIVISAPLVADNWSGFGENGTLIVGGLVLIATCSAQSVPSLPKFLKGITGVHIARIVFAFAAFLMTMDNFPYPKANADFPPTWIPHWYGWGYLVGSAYVATGLSILFRICSKFATNAAAAMMSLITLLCWGAFVVHAPTSYVQWTGLFISSALTGAGWMVAESYRADPWFEIRWPGLRALSRNRNNHPEERA